METFYHDHATLEEFVRRFANAGTYNTCCAGQTVDAYWQEEAKEWVRELDSKSKSGE